jgi:hypothetical protein
MRPCGLLSLKGGATRYELCQMDMYPAVHYTGWYSESTAIGKKLEDIIGYNFLNQFKVTVNYPRSMLELARAVLP